MVQRVVGSILRGGPIELFLLSSQCSTSGVVHIKEPLLLIGIFCPGQTEPAKCTCVRDRRALQQLALNVNVILSDLT